MILFRDDWDYWPTADIDTSTKNKSFIQIAALWRDMGIKNHAFPLALINPNLKGIDPFAPDLTKEEIGAISYECRINPWYFFREVARAPARSGSEPGLFLANRGNMCLYWCYFNHIFITLIQPRQTGKSLSLDELVSLLGNILCRNANINLLTKDDTLRRENVKRLKDIVDLLPGYLNQMGKKGSRNSENITFSQVGNAFQTFLPQSSLAGANNVGRGMTTETMLFDEGPFQPNFSIAFPAAMASAGAAQDIAKTKNEPHGVICTTTSGKIDSPSGSFFYNELLQTAAHWDDPFFLDAKNHEDLTNRIISMCRKSPSYTKEGAKIPQIIVPRINATFSHRQLGYTDDWLREKIAKASGPRDGAERDYLNVWTNGQADSPFSPDTTARIVKSEKKVVYRDYDNKKNFLLNWYIPQRDIQTVMNERDILMGMDSSDAVGGDTMGIVFTDSRSLNTVAAATFNNMSLFSFSEWIADILIKYPRVLWVPECRSSGMAIIDQVSEILMSHGIDPFKRIFNRIVQEKEEMKELFEELRKPIHARRANFYDMNKGLFGYKTSGAGNYTRERLYGTVLSTATQRFAEVINDKTLIQQLMGLSVKNGRIDHGTNGHDDQVIAWLLNVWLLLFGKNLSFYGLDPLNIFSEEPRREEVTLTLAERTKRYQQEKNHKRIAELLERLGKEKEEFVVSQLERELKHLDRNTVKNDRSINNMHELIEKAREQRLRSRRTTESSFKNFDSANSLNNYRNMYSSSVNLF